MCAERSVRTNIFGNLFNKAQYMEITRFICIVLFWGGRDNCDIHIRFLALGSYFCCCCSLGLCIHFIIFYDFNVYNIIHSLIIGSIIIIIIIIVYMPSMCCVCECNVCIGVFMYVLVVNFVYF